MASSTGSDSTPTSSSSEYIPTPPSPLFTTYLPLLGLTISPLLAALPPRKLDLYTFTLGAVTVISAEELYSGRIVKSRWMDAQLRRREGLPVQQYKSEDAHTLYDKLKLKKQENEVVGSFPSVKDESNQSRIREAVNQRRGVKGLVQNIYYGDEQPGSDWQKKRAQEDQDVLDQGGSIWEIISTRVSDVYSGAARRRDEDGNANDGKG